MKYKAWGNLGELLGCRIGASKQEGRPTTSVKPSKIHSSKEKEQFQIEGGNTIKEEETITLFLTT